MGLILTVGVSMLLEAEHLLELARRGGRLGVVVAAEVDPADEDIGHLARVRGGAEVGATLRAKGLGSSGASPKPSQGTVRWPEEASSASWTAGPFSISSSSTWEI